MKEPSDVNMMGRSHRGSLSPERKRFSMFVKEAHPYMNCRLPEVVKGELIRIRI